jgi:hypothetical protein
MPPRGVKKGTKRARQYEHVKDSAKDQGASESRAEEIAARTVNKDERAAESPANGPGRRRRCTATKRFRFQARDQPASLSASSTSRRRETDAPICRL